MRISTNTCLMINVNGEANFNLAGGKRIDRRVIMKHQGKRVPSRRVLLPAVLFRLPGLFGAALVAAVLVSSALVTAAAAADPTIWLANPTYTACGGVTITGAVSGNIFGPPIWDWGDGTTTKSWFAASHRYEANGSYTVLTTAQGCRSASDSKLVTITNAENPGCPPMVDYSSTNIFPYNLHLVAGQTTDTPLQFRDQSGNPVTGVTEFIPNDPTLISISADGYVTALRTEATTEIGTWLHAKLNGNWLASACVVRILPTNYGVTFSEVVGENTVLYYPVNIKGENIDVLVDLYQMPTVNDYAYQIQRDLLGLQTFGGSRQIFAVDFGISETSRVCGLSGNPIRLGWNIEGNNWQNCFLIPLLPPRSPHWMPIFHEMGHNFLSDSPGFVRALGTALGTDRYNESIATALMLADIAYILENESTYPTETLTWESLIEVYSLNSTQYLNGRQNWLNGGADFSNLNNDIVDGIWLYHAESNVSRFASKFFLPLQPQNLEVIRSVLCAVETINDQHTFYAALLSAAAGEDLSALFIDTYHFPINQSLFDNAYSIFATIIAVASMDTDYDGIADVDDNCPAICNTQQLDADSDGVGDVCDINPSCGGCGQVACEQSCDTDNDGILNASDNCPNTCNPQQLDADDDGTGDVCDTSPGCGGCGQVACEVVCTP